MLDLQHAFEFSVDSGVPFEEVVSGLVDVFSRFGGISHLDVRGEISEEGIQRHPHVQLSVATNREAIISALDLLISQSDRLVPIILEGDPIPNFSFLPSSGRLRQRKVAEITSQAVENITAEFELRDRTFPRKLRFLP